MKCPDCGFAECQCWKKVPMSNKTIETVAAWALFIAEFLVRGVVGAIAVMALLGFGFYSAAHPDWLFNLLCVGS